MGVGAWRRLGLSAAAVRVLITGGGARMGLIQVRLSLWLMVNVRLGYFRLC